MAFEPRTVTIDEANPELEDMERRFWRSTAITAPILAFMISEFLSGRPRQAALPHGWMNWIQLAPCRGNPVSVVRGVAEPDDRKCRNDPSARFR